MVSSVPAAVLAASGISPCRVSCHEAPQIVDAAAFLLFDGVCSSSELLGLAHARSVCCCPRRLFLPGDVRALGLGVGVAGIGFSGAALRSACVCPSKNLPKAWLRSLLASSMIRLASAADSAWWPTTSSICFTRGFSSEPVSALAASGLPGMSTTSTASAAFSASGVLVIAMMKFFLASWLSTKEWKSSIILSRCLSRSASLSRFCSTVSDLVEPPPPTTVGSMRLGFTNFTKSQSSR
mmetsp:Transcript_10741/g.40356  ORF Transcript_10741/g.40356 Transcript_10741/m.40356 type:complete len:238 (+) Transcript_10741:2785-3498(+)